MVVDIWTNIFLVNLSTHTNKKSNVNPPVNLFYSTCLFLYPLEISENFWLSDVFRGYRKRLVVWNGLVASSIWIQTSFQGCWLKSHWGPRPVFRYPTSVRGFWCHLDRTSTTPLSVLKVGLGIVQIVNVYNQAKFWHCITWNLKVVIFTFFSGTRKCNMHFVRMTYARIVWKVLQLKMVNDRSAVNINRKWSLQLVKTFLYYC